MTPAPTPAPAPAAGAASSLTSSTLPPYKIRGTKVYSPYPVHLTPAETRLIFTLQSIFDPAYIYPDCYFPQSLLRSSPNISSQPAMSSSCFTPDATILDYQTNRHLTSDSNLTQIDCLALSQQGIFVFESKDYHGWIYGTAEQKFWTVTLNYGREKHSFYNPLRQNAAHLAALRTALSNFPRLAQLPFYSVIVFGSETVLKTSLSVPKNCLVCLQPALRSRLTQLPTNLLTPDDLQTLSRLIQASRVSPTDYIRQTHISEICATTHQPSHF